MLFTFLYCNAKSRIWIVKEVNAPLLEQKMKKKQTETAIVLLKRLIKTPSFSTEEDKTAQIISEWFDEQGIPFHRVVNNLWATNKYFDENKPTLLLNSHHDTVQPNTGYTRDPFCAHLEDGKLYGLGSNDAGGCLVSLLTCFAHFYHKKDLAYNLLMTASAEEEISGENGLKSILTILPKIDLAIVGEPTLMHLAITEKGLLVFDAKIKGTPGHAAHPNNNNAINKTIEVLSWFKNYKFNKTSHTLGEVKMTVTQINAGIQHNSIPAEVDLVIDVRVNDLYSNEEVTEIIKRESPCDVIEPRCLLLKSSSILITHPLVQAGIALGMKTYGSPTLSDQSKLSCPSVKLGPGDSTRSHSADEFIYVREIEEGIEKYIELLNNFLSES